MVAPLGESAAEGKPDIELDVCPVYPARMMLIYLAIYLQVPPTSACMPLTDGPAQGLCAGDTITHGELFEVVALRGSDAPPPPISRETQQIVDRLIAFQQTGDRIPKAMLADEATVAFCPDLSSGCDKTKPLTRWPIASGFNNSRPYLLNDGRVRIAWFKDGTMKLLSFVSLEGSKVRDITTLPAAVPVKPRS